MDIFNKIGFKWIYFCIVLVRFFLKGLGFCLVSRIYIKSRIKFGYKSIVEVIGESLYKL